MPLKKGPSKPQGKPGKASKTAQKRSKPRHEEKARQEASQLVVDTSAHVKNSVLFLKDFPELNLPQKMFLAVYSHTANLTAAAEVSEVARSNHYFWLSSEPCYPAAFKIAGEIAVERLEGIAWSRARITSDTLMIFLLKFLKSDVYNPPQRVHSTSSVGGIPGQPIETKEANLLDLLKPEQRQQLALWLKEAGVKDNG